MFCTHNFFFQFKTKAVQIQTGAVGPFPWKLQISWNIKMNKHGIKMQFCLWLRPLHIMGLIDSPTCNKCEADEEISAHVFCEWKALAALRHTYLGSFFLDPDDVRSLNLGAIWNLIKRTGLLWLGHQFKGHKGPVIKACVHRDLKGSNSFIILLYSILWPIPLAQWTWHYRSITGFLSNPQKSLA
jgi:hypothetical protein